MAEDTELRYWAFVSGLVGGVLILAGAVAGFLMLTFIGPFGGMGRMVGTPFADSSSLMAVALWMLLWGLIAGAIAVVAAVRLRDPEASGTAWGIGLIVAGAVSFLGMGGFMLGGVAAIAAGVLALVSEHPARASERPAT